jgi:hypothetical protein
LYQEIVILTVQGAIVLNFLLQEIVGIRISHIPEISNCALSPSTMCAISTVPPTDKSTDTDHPVRREKSSSR